MFRFDLFLACFIASPVNEVEVCLTYWCSSGFNEFQDK